MKQLVCGGLLAALCAFSALAQSHIDAEGVADGKTVLWFYGTEVTARIESEFSVAGTLDLGGTTVDFTALGTAYGEGVGDSAAMTLDVWLLFDAVGETAEGVPIHLRGGMTGSSEDADLSSSVFGSAAGPFLFLVTLGTDSYRALGTAEGSAAGAFVVPDDPATMQMEGTGTYVIAGDLVRNDDAEGFDPLAYVPWEPSAWPVDLHGRLLDLLGPTLRQPDDPAGE